MLPGSNLLSLWWCATKTNRYAGNEKLTASLWPRICPLFAYNSDFSGETQHACASIGSIFFRHDSLWVLSVLHTEENDEKDAIWVTGWHFGIMQNVIVQLYSIPNELVQQCFQQWNKYWEKCLQSQEEYFEGDWSFISELQVNNIFFLPQGSDTFWTVICDDALKIYLFCNKIWGRWL